VISATSDHPFFVAGKWLKVAALRAGDSVTTYSGARMAIRSIERVPMHATVHNFEVAGYHTYYVSKLRVLVHNAGPCNVNLKKLYKQAEKEFPKKVGKPDELHHVAPKYLGGPSNGELVKIPAAYHQKITNAFRAIRGYGKGPVSDAERSRIMAEVYKKLPLPKK